MGQGFFNADMELFVDHRVDWERLLRLRRGPDAALSEELDTYRVILQTAGEVCADIQADASGHWHEEVKLVDGEVRVPPHIAAGYEKLRSAGLTCLTLSPDHGGAGLPLLLNCAFLEMLSRADASLMTIVGLQGGVAADIEKYGSQELKQLYLPRFATGELQGSMDLTEAQAGSDLGGVTTRATRENGAYFIDGEKIFITNGCAQIHLVLAREGETFDRSKGTTKGLSLMLCPMTLPDGTANRIRISRVENKLGIHGSPTCVVEFDHAQAFLLGEAGEGFRAMLDLMNAARLGVAAQAIGIAEAAYREARAHAEQRVQFGSTIIQHPLVKSMLTMMAINIQAARALLYHTCSLIDMTEAIRVYLASERSAEDPERSALEAEIEHHNQLIRFFTPLCKYYATEISNDVTRNAIQVHGGIGYMAETAAGHHHADSIITTIYEGTSEIQASFALREMSKGALSTALEDTGRQLDKVPERFSELVAQVRVGMEWINKSLPALMGDIDYALLNAKRISEMVIDVLVSAELLAQAQVSDEKAVLAAAFINRHMLAVEMKARRIASGDASRIKGYNQILGLE
jgi:alkylation response protein AidB-like acyl-CoA dehydrogenase